MRKFGLYIAIAIAGTLPGLVLRFSGAHVSPVLASLLFGVMILCAGFMLSWGAEAAEAYASQGLIVAILALITVLPEYAVDIYYSFKAGQQPGSEYVGFAAANMTGANRLLIGVIWPVIILLYWLRTRRTAIQLRWENSIEITFLALATIYSFFITFKASIELLDTVILVALFGAYLWRVARLPNEEEEEEGVGPAAALSTLPRKQQFGIMGALAVYAAFAILAGAEPFAESLVATGEVLGVDKFLLIQWLAPLASEAPAATLAVLLVLSFRATASMGSLISDKINQWTLLVGMIPLAFSVGAAQFGSLPLDARQQEEFFLTAAQSLFALTILLRLRLTVAGAMSLLGLFSLQFGLGLYFRDDEARATMVLTYVAWLYLILAFAMLAWHLVRNRTYLVNYVKIALLNQPAPTEAAVDEAQEAETTNRTRRDARAQSDALDAK